ncbi:MAG TPA: tripartite tricarboxylate transporter substrate binding protein [Burkholderiales bacterium]|nr:tripartite tricarboxylate transporter substrate binding protein [Burkholderiales bacterium]
MKTCLRAMAACAGLLLAAAWAQAQTFPAKPVRIVVPLAPGGSTDVLARLVAAKLTELWGQQVVVENRGGAGTMIGAEAVARAAPDGYTMLMVTSAFSVNFSLYDKVPYKFSDFVALSNVGQTPNVLAVHPSVPAKNVKELIALLRARPGQMTYSSGGVGGSTHLAGELFKLLAKVDMVHVPYKGGGPAVADLVGGQVMLTFANLTTVLPFANAGRLRALAVTSIRRSPALPELPTMAEAGVPGFDASTWNGLIAPAATPKEIVAKLNADIVRVLNMPDTRQKLASQGLEPIGDSPAAFAAHISNEIARWGKVVKAAGIRAE